MIVGRVLLALAVLAALPAFAGAVVSIWGRLSPRHPSPDDLVTGCCARRERG